MPYSCAFRAARSPQSREVVEVSFTRTMNASESCSPLLKGSNDFRLTAFKSLGTATGFPVSLELSVSESGDKFIPENAALYFSDGDPFSGGGGVTGEGGALDRDDPGDIGEILCAERGGVEQDTGIGAGIVYPATSRSLGDPAAIGEDSQAGGGGFDANANVATLGGHLMALGDSFRVAISRNVLQNTVLH